MSTHLVCPPARALRLIAALLVLSSSCFYQFARADEARESIMDRKVTLEKAIIKDLPKVPRLCDAMTVPKERINVGDCELYCEREGTGVPIVLLHGGPGSTHHYFHPSFSQAASFAQVIYCDQRGCGLSDFKPGGGYTVEQATDDLENLRKALGLGKWFVVGHSYGGLLAQCYAMKYPESLRGLVLVGASPGSSYKGGSRQDEFLLLEEQRAIAKAHSDKSLTTAQSIYNAFLNGDWKRQCFYKPSPERMVQIATYEWKHDRGFNGTMSGDSQRRNFSGVFEGCPIPTLILEGDWDLTWNKSKIAFMKTLHPEATLVTFDRAGHSPFDDEPGTFFEALKTFVTTARDVPEADLQAWKQRLESNKSALLGILQTSGYGTKSNEAISKAYTKDELPKLAESGEYLRVGMALYDTKRYEDALDVFLAFEIAAEDETERGIALVWQGHVLDLMGRRQEAIAAYRKATDLNVDYSIRHDQFGIRYDLKKYPKMRMETPFTRMENKNTD